MPQNVGYAARPRMRLVGQLGVGKTLPGRDQFIGFANVGVNQVLKERIVSLRDLGFVNEGFGLHERVYQPVSRLTLAIQYNR
ncbi:MAG: hypothetical protein WKF37_08570 [Bryobacteraceae bacterium]